MFVSGISRFVLIWSGVGFLVMGTLFDWLWNGFNTATEKKNPYVVEVIGSDTALKDQVRE